MSVLRGLIHGATTLLLAVSAAASTAQTGNAPPPAPPRPVGAAQQASSSPLDRIVSIDLKAVPLRDALHAIATQANVPLEYSSRVVPVNKVVNLLVANATVRTALTEALRGTDVEFVVTPQNSVLLVRRQGRGKITGQVTDSVTKQPVAHATVTITGSDTSATETTGTSGSYAFEVAVGRYVLRVHLPGYVPDERTIVMVDSQIVAADFQLSRSPTQLDAVIVTATGPRRRLDVGNDVTILNADSIVRTEPISSVTQMLEARVPGLEVVHTSGAPGDPSRLRLRGASSAFSSNDPIVIVDGVRIFAAQSDSQSGNLARSNLLPYIVAAPSALDQIDPNSIETIEVFKGSSASSMYGTDAANGVIVITTKRGRPGPARWTMEASRATTFMPGQYPLGTYRFGTDVFGDRVLCLLSDFSCRADSVVRFQALNAPAYTILGHGDATQLSLGVSGGVGALTYSVTGSTDQETGSLKLPSLEAQQYFAQNATPPPSWMLRPQQLSRWTGSSRLMARLNDRTDVSLSTSITRETQQRSDLENQIATLMTTYVDVDSLSFWRGAHSNDFTASNVLLPSFYTRTTDDATNLLTAATLTWRPGAWLYVTADAGLNAISRTDQVLLPNGIVASADTTGDLTEAHGNTRVSTVNLRTSAALPLAAGFRLQIAGGATYTKTSSADLSIEARGLVHGTTSISGAGKITNSSESGKDVTSFGWYVEPAISHRVFTVTTGLRIDGSSSFGSHVTLPAPKFGLSYLVSEEPWFPLKRVFDLLRVRAAYGVGGVWPGPTDQLRLYQPSQFWLNGGYVNGTIVTTLGNTRIRPERSTEWEGGFDTDLLRDHLSVALSTYRKIRRDALMVVPVAPSVYGGGVSIFQNIGEIRNTGLELTVTTEVVRSNVVSWSETLNFSQNHNLVVALGPGVTPFDLNGPARVAPGYPLFGYWAKPILAYYDANHDGIIEASEVRLGDTAVYMGSSEPKYQASLFTAISLFRGAVTATAGLSYQHAFTQFNQGMRGFFFSSVADPSSPQSAQASAAVADQTAYGFMETVSVLRLNSFSLAYNLPQRLASRMGAQGVSVQLQGTNLGLWTKYRGKDPNVNVFSTGNIVADAGVLPIPRTWRLSARVAY